MTSRHIVLELCNILCSVVWTRLRIYQIPETQQSWKSVVQSPNEFTKDYVFSKIADSCNSYDSYDSLNDLAAKNFVLSSLSPDLSRRVSKLLVTTENVTFLNMADLIDLQQGGWYNEATGLQMVTKFLKNYKKAIKKCFHMQQDQSAEYMKEQGLNFEATCIEFGDFYRTECNAGTWLPSKKAFNVVQNQGTGTATNKQDVTMVVRMETLPRPDCNVHHRSLGIVHHLPPALNKPKWYKAKRTIGARSATVGQHCMAQNSIVQKGMEQALQVKSILPWLRILPLGTVPITDWTIQLQRKHCMPSF
jgi:hypothetical protein